MKALTSSVHAFRKVPITSRATYKHLVGAFVGAIDTVVGDIDTVDEQSPQDSSEQKLSFEVEEPLSHVQRSWLKVDAPWNM